VRSTYSADDSLVFSKEQSSFICFGH
jgi:hypothetical protein